MKLAKYEESVSSDMQLGDRSIWDLEFMHTGRKVRGTEGYALATEWAQLLDSDELIKHPAAEVFRSLIHNAPCIDFPLVCFRARGIIGISPYSYQMGPPPVTEGTSGGRYNCPGESVLYLSDSEDGVIREFCALGLPWVPYIQRYRFSPDKLRIADFTNIPPDHFVSQAFSKAEECNVEGRGLPDYNFSQTLAELVAANFDGMRVPGVRGVPGEQYSNIIIFRPFPDWPNWLEPGSAPYCFLKRNF
jgi:hypothetical protein